MSYKNVKKYFEDAGLCERVKVLEQSSATVEMAAEAVGCEIKQIAKTLSFMVGDAPILVVAAGNVKIDNKKYKTTFHQKSKMVPSELVEEYIGHDIGGVCPFAVNPNVSIYLDISLKENDIIYPGAGNENSVVELSIEELETHSSYKSWVDVCKEVS
jgi:prolyl-tRNA editing enzyme YbaK/EbsC (Cys-tRNA(Pro) deacylase)